MIHGCIAASFWLFLATLPPFHIGLWVDSEAVLVAMFGVYALLGGALLCVPHPLKASQRSYLCVLMALISGFATLWSENKTMHHWGTPMLGEGTALWTGLMLLSLGYDQLDGARLRWIKRSACAAAVVAGALVLCNNARWLGWHPEWAPYTFGAFLAPMALVLGLCTTLWAALPLLILSHNKTFIMASAASCLAWLWLRSKSSKWLVVIVLAIPVVAIAWDFLGYAIWQAQNIDAPTLVMDHWWSLRSRALSIMVYGFSWWDEPWRLLCGYGWGSYFQHLQENITSLPIELFHNQAWRPNWDGVDRIDFHVMHQGLENLFSLGLAGLAVYIAMLILPLKRIAFKPFLVAVSFAAVTSTWFTLPSVWPYWMLAWVLVLPKGEAAYVVIGKKTSYLSLMLAIFIVGQAGLNQWNTACLFPAREDSWLRSFTCSKVTSTSWGASYNYHGFHMPYFVFNLMGKRDQIAPDVLHHELARTLSTYNPQNSTLLMDISMLHVFKYMSAIDATYGNTWFLAVKAILAKAPKRSDMAQTFIQYALQHQRHEDVCVLVESMLVKNPCDVCALWYKGLYLNNANQTQQGLESMKQALNLGVKKWLPIPQDLLSIA